MFAGEVLLRLVFGLEPLALDKRHVAPYIVIPLGLALIRSKKIIFGLVAAMAVLQIIWFGTFRYFGSVLGPDLIILGTQQLFEIGIAARGEWQIFVLPIMTVILFNIAFAWLLLRLRKGHPAGLDRLGLFLVLLPLIVIGVRSFVHTRLFVLRPSPFMPSHTGVVQATSLAIRGLLTESRYSDDGAPRLKIGAPAAIAGRKGDGPVTVVLIMGESINPLQLGFYGAPVETTPKMTARLKAAASGRSRMRYIVKAGFSAGTATLASVPLFIRMAYNPVAAKRRARTVFELAKKQGFSVGYYSAQNIKPLQIGGGREFIDVVQTNDTWRELFERKRDAVMFDMMEKYPLKGKKRFYFMHQRSNHGPYVCFAKGDPQKNPAADPAAIRRDASISRDNGQMRRLRRYRHGLLCYDRSLDDLLAYFGKMPGEAHIFITADHNELMGAKGLWGHSKLDLNAALVPMMLVTNRPDSEIARRFAALQTPSAFDFMREVAFALGREIGLDKPPGDNMFYTNGAVAYGRRGYMKVERTARRDSFKVGLILPNNERRAAREERIFGLEDILAYIEKRWRDSRLLAGARRGKVN
jgi:glucan phosphoethanolaminetransferase (alkaline phosphatase superfamily)